MTTNDKKVTLNQSRQSSIAMEEVYRRLPEEKIPWNIETPPELLVDFLKQKQIAPCKGVDLGCGPGNYAIYLAKNGFEMTGVDISPTAIKIARQKSAKKEADAAFLCADLTENPFRIFGAFDFAFEWEVLHHILPEKRDRYIKNISQLLNSKGRYLAVCFSEEDTNFGGQGKYRKTPISTLLYFSTKDELEKLYAPHFNIIEIKTVSVPGNKDPHAALCAHLEKP